MSLKYRFWSVISLILGALTLFQPISVADSASSKIISDMSGVNRPAMAELTLDNKYRVPTGKAAQSGDVKNIIKFCSGFGELSNNCYSDVGMFMYMFSPSSLMKSLEICSKLPSTKEIGNNRTPNKFCGSGVFGAGFNALYKEQKLGKYSINDFSQYINWCLSLPNGISYPCVQSGGYNLTSNLKMNTVLKICSNLKDIFLVDQCYTGTFRSLSLLRDDIDSTFNKKSYLACASVTTLNLLSSKCFASIGMSAPVNSEKEIKGICTSALKNTRVDRCYQFLGSAVFGNSHGDILKADKMCSSSDRNFYSNCAVGVFKAYIYTLKALPNGGSGNPFGSCFIMRDKSTLNSYNLCLYTVAVSFNPSEISTPSQFMNIFDACSSLNSEGCFYGLGEIAKSNKIKTDKKFLANPYFSKSYNGGSYLGKNS